MPLRLARQRLIIYVIENVPEFAVHLVEMELKDLYDSFVIQAKPQDLGLQMSRQRIYIILHPKKKNAIVDGPLRSTKS